MDETGSHRFSTRVGFEAQFREVLARSGVSLQLFDPDLSVYRLGDTDVDAALRRFLAGGGTLELAMHDSAHIERHCPRFLRLLKDFGHRAACRITGRNLHHLTDSFCIGDGVNIVRRFHSDHLRGEAAFGSAPATEISLERFRAIWVEAVPGLHPTTIGL
jgi:hypothetical protein